jgi:hypothetical protein
LSLNSQRDHEENPPQPAEGFIEAAGGFGATRRESQRFSEGVFSS